MKKKLARLNATKSPTDNLYPKDLIYQLKIASLYSIYESYNTFSYFIERLVTMYENTDEVKKLIRNSFLELLEVCNLTKLLSIRNTDKIRSLLDIISLDEREKELSSKSIDIEEDTKILVVNLLKKGKNPQEISDFLEIEIEKINNLTQNYI